MIFMQIIETNANTSCLIKDHSDYLVMEMTYFTALEFGAAPSICSSNIVIKPVGSNEVYC